MEREPLESEEERKNPHYIYFFHSLFSTHFVPKAEPDECVQLNSSVGSYNSERNPIFLARGPGKGGPMKKRINGQS